MFNYLSIIVLVAFVFVKPIISHSEETYDVSSDHELVPDDKVLKLLPLTPPNQLQRQYFVAATGLKDKGKKEYKFKYKKRYIKFKDANLHNESHYNHAKQNHINESVNINQISSPDVIDTGKDTKVEFDKLDNEIFGEPNDVRTILRNIYKSLSSHISSLRSKIVLVNHVAEDVLNQLTTVDCSDLKDSSSGLHTFHLDHFGKKPVTVYCDQDTDGGGWTVIQQRLPRTLADANCSTDFDRGWHDYKVGFGKASDDYWVGLENLYIWTNYRHYELRIDLTDFNGDEAYSHYGRFYIEDEAHAFRIHISDYNGTAGDSLTNVGVPDNYTADGMMFSTKDNDHDTSHEINCSKYWNIGGWWFNRCSWANLNGPYEFPGFGDGIGINWHKWRNKQYMRTTVVMIRPTKD